MSAQSRHDSTAQHEGEEWLRASRAWGRSIDWGRAKYARLSAGLLHLQPSWLRSAAVEAARAELALIMLGAALLQGAALLALSSWQIDDAGITFAYARSLANGHGLVSQPGFSPVEGYSNPTWLLLCAALIKLGLFDISWTPKLLAAACMLWTHYSAYQLVRKDLEQSLWTTSIVQLLLGTNASLLVWSNSGLENALFAALLLVATRLVMRITARGGSPRTLALKFGVVAALIALTRPDGMIFFAALPLSLLSARRLRESARTTLVAAAPFLCLTGLHLIFRLQIFGQWVPNTVTMKGGPQPAELARALLLTSSGVSKIEEAFSAVFAIKSFWIVALLAMLLVRARQMFADARYKALGLFGALAFVEFLVMPNDWMPYQRFATPLIVVACVFIPLTASRCWGRSGASESVRLLLAAGLVWMVAANGVKLFKFDPPIALRSVIAEAREINAIARELGVKRGC